MERTSWLSDGLPIDAPGLEIGPLDRPIMTRPGSRVLYADHLDREGLRAKYAGHAPVSLDSIPEIDFVIDSRGLRAGTSGHRFHYVIASHVLEHIPDPIAWLRDVHDMLADGGVLVLALPDFHRCFDALRRPTVAGEWIGAYLEGRSRPSPAAIFDALCNEVTVNGGITWGDGAEPREMILSRSPREAYEYARRNVEGDEYLDVHCSTFDPATFCNLLRTVALAGLLPLRLDAITGTHGLEFFVRLRRDDRCDRGDIVASYPASGGRYDLLPAGFDAVAYYRNNPDVKAAGMDPNDHYIQYGWREGRSYA